MIVNGQALLKIQPVKPMLNTKVKTFGVSHGLAEAGYDIRIQQDVMFVPQGQQYTPFPLRAIQYAQRDINLISNKVYNGRFALASSIEEFLMPPTLVGIVHDKSTWARKGLSVFNTVIEPDWHGYLTLELVYHGQDVLHIPAGVGIAQVIFHKTQEEGYYDGKYQNQPDRPVEAVFETEVPN